MRQGCHLCEDMLADLQPLLQERGVPLELIDVDGSPGMQHYYGQRIPVLESSAGECLSELFLDEAAVARYLDMS